MNGLPGEFDPIKSATRMRLGDLKFEELTSIIKADDMILQQAQNKTISKPDTIAALVATRTSCVQRPTILYSQGHAMHSSQVNSSIPNVGYNPAVFVQLQQQYYNQSQPK